MATPTPATLSEALEYIDKDPGPDDVEVTAFLEAATEAAEGWHNVGPIVVRSFTDRVTARRGRLILPRRPVQSVTSATSIADGTVIQAADLDLNTRTGIVQAAPTSGHIFPSDYDVLYDAGRNPVPVSLKEAVLIIFGHLWQTQQGPTTNRWPGQETSDNFRVSRGYLIPHRAAHLLRPHIRVQVA